jgi:hypothetical protein
VEIGPLAQRIGSLIEPVSPKCFRLSIARDMTNGVCVVESKRDSDSTPNIRLKLSDTMKPLVELPIEHYESLLKRASENSPLYFRLKNAIKTDTGTIAILCDPDEAEMLLQVAKHFWSNAMPQIERAIRLARFPG